MVCWCHAERPNVQLTVYVFVYSVNIFFFHAFYDQNTLVNVNVIVLVWAAENAETFSNSSF